MLTNSIKINDEEFLELRDIIYKNTAIAFVESKKYLLENRLTKRLGELNFKSFKDYIYYLKYDINRRKEMDILFNLVTINETYFLRERPQMDHLIAKTIPELIAAGKRNIRIWSAACSTGEEPYTIAMLLNEILPQPYKFEIIASDISLKCLMTAKEGFYADNRISGIPDAYLKKYFDKVDGGYKVRADLMSKIRFDYHNLKNDSGQRNFDVVFCRNVIIYFDEAAQTAVINRFWNAMAPKSFLFIGHSESLFGMDTKFEFIKTQWATLYGKS